MIDQNFDTFDKDYIGDTIWTWGFVWAKPFDSLAHAAPRDELDTGERRVSKIRRYQGGAGRRWEERTEKCFCFVFIRLCQIV